VKLFEKKLKQTLNAHLKAYNASLRHIIYVTAAENVTHPHNQILGQTLSCECKYLVSYRVNSKILRQQHRGGPLRVHYATSRLVFILLEGVLLAHAETPRQ